ncbi:hypothetical protein T265_04232 [Opisthorchis viverrini]|uniref:Uncharacterized protein n=1 Tax=Opisthorchis viverrini TaxID=6198 RepID=A0A075AGT5_OPIVI|nr:hypothetical protein T265_04232 [Opisthorchis viverrini]KER29044.1 hypothetical protein T265_04232 [Opisthorchis viverrini]
MENRGLRLPDEPQEGRNRSWAVDEFSATFPKPLPEQSCSRSAVAPFRCLTATPPEGCTRAGILTGCPSLDRGSREEEVGF